MYKQRRNVNFHLVFFIRKRFWPLFILWITILFLTFCPHICQSIQINNNENPDRTVTKLGPRDIQITTTSSPSPLSIPVVSSNSDLHEITGHTLYVISLDGKITAIDARADGRQLWTTDTGAPLVDSSLSKIDISRDSRSVHLIPSLIGGLYEKYDEDGHVEPLPFDADSLLDSSFKFHDEVVMTGGKHIDTLGLDLHTGKILYSFTKDDPKQQNTLDNNRTTTTTADTNDHGPTLIVKRTTQTVRARNVRNGHEKWNFSVSNHHLFHVRNQHANVVFGQVDAQPENQLPFAGYFEYQLQTGVVVAFNEFGHPVWSSAVNAPIAAVWELKNGQLNEKSLFETTTSNYYPNENTDQDDSISSPPVSRRLAFIGEFNSTPYVLISPSVQKQLIYDARKNNVAGAISNQRTLLSSWHKAYQKRTLSIGAELLENNNAQNTNTPTSSSHYPLALRPDPTANPHSHLSSIDETCDTAGYLELIANANQHFFTETPTNRLNTHTYVYIPKNVVIIFTLIIGAVFIIAIWYLKQNQITYLSQKSTTSETSICTTITPPTTPDDHQIEQLPQTPSFQSRYTVEYEHVRFLGRGGFGVVFEAINKLDQRQVAIKRVSLKKASGKERALKEIRYLAVLNHPNLIQYYYAWNESPPTGWQEEEDKLLLVRDNANKRDSISTFPTTGNDSASINQCRSGSTGTSSIPAVKPSVNSHPLSFEITFDRSSHPLLIDENFSANSSNPNEQSDNSSSSSSSSFDQQIDANNNTKSTTKSSLSSASPLFDHSSDSSNEKPVEKKERTESDDGIVFLPDEKQSVSLLSIPTQTKIISNEKEIPPTYFYFVMELCQPESLRDRLTQRKIDRQQAWSIFDQIIKGIEYIHSQKLIHRDLKPSNILFSMDNTVKIGDFGLVSAFGDEKLSKKIKQNNAKFGLIESTSLTTDGCGNIEHGGTILYMSPEQVNREPYNQKVDIYAMGIILFELLYPFSTQMERMQSLANVRLQIPVFPKDFAVEGNNRSQMIRRLICWLLSYSQHDRPRASELRQDTFYQRLLQCEVPNLFTTIYRQQSQTMVNGQDQVPICQPRARIPSSSPFRRTVSSSAIESHKESESGDGECVL